jgi:hypothetical protein
LKDPEISPSVVSCAKRIRSSLSAEPFVALGGRIYQPDPTPSLTVKLLPLSKSDAQVPGRRLAFDSPEEAGPSIPIVTQESYTRSGRIENAAAELFTGVAPPKMGSWKKLVVVFSAKGKMSLPVNEVAASSANSMFRKRR